MKKKRRNLFSFWKNVTSDFLLEVKVKQVSDMIVVDIWEFSPYRSKIQIKKDQNSLLLLFHNLTTAIPNTNEYMINLKTLNYSSAFHSLSLEKTGLPLGMKLEAGTNGLTTPRAGTEDFVKDTIERTLVRLAVLRTQSSKSDFCKGMRRLQEIPCPVTSPKLSGLVFLTENIQKRLACRITSLTPGEVPKSLDE